MATLAELRELYPSVYQGKSDFAAVKLLADARQASLPLVAYELGLNPEDYYQNESNSQDFGTDLAIGGAEAVRGVVGIANIAAAPFTDQQLITTPGLDEYIQRKQATMSPNRQRAQGELDQAWEDGGFWNIASEYASEPAYLTGMGLQSAPAMVGGGVGGMALRGVARLGAGAMARGLGAAAPYIGEGAIAGGMDYAQMVEQGVDPQVAAGYGALAGAGVGALGGVGGAFANRMGITDVSRALSGARRVDGDVPLSYGRQLGYGSLNEAGQEILQSPWEQAMQNLATDQPVTEGLARSAVEGGILGGVMGAGFNAMPRGRELDLTQDRDNTQGLVNPAQPFAGVPGGNTTPESPQARRQADLEAAFGAADQNLGLSSGHFDANLGRELTLGELPSEVYDAKLGRNLTHAELITNPDYQGTVAKPTAPKAATAPKASPPESPTLAALRQRYAANPTWPTKGLLSTKGAVLPGFAKTRLPALQVIIGQNTPEEAIKRLRVEQDAVNQKKGDLAPHVSRLIDVLIAEQEAKLASQGQTTSAKADTAGTVPEGNGLAPKAESTSVMPAQETPAPAAPQDALGEFPPYPGPAAETGTSLADLAARNQPKPKVTSGGEQVDLTQDAAPTGTDGLIADAAQAEQLPTTQAPKQTNQKLVIDDADADHSARFDATLDQVATKRNIPPPARAVLADLMQRYFRIGKYHEYSGVQPPSYTSMAAALNDSGYEVSHTTAGIIAKEFQDLYAAELERQGKPVEYFDPQAMAWTGTLDDGNQRGTRSLDATAEEFNAEQDYGRDELVDAAPTKGEFGDITSEEDTVLATGNDGMGQFGATRDGDAPVNAIGEEDATAADATDDIDLDEELGYRLGGIGSKADAAAGGIGGADTVSARPRAVKFYADRHLFAANKYREARGEPPLTPKQAKAELSKLSDVALARHFDRLKNTRVSDKRLADVNDPKPKLVDAYAALQDDLAALGTGALRGEKSGRTVVELETPDTTVAEPGAVVAWQKATRDMPNAPALDTVPPKVRALWDDAYNGVLALPDANRLAVLRKYASDLTSLLQKYARELSNEQNPQPKRGDTAGTAAQPQAGVTAGTELRPDNPEGVSESGSAQPELATGGREAEAPAGDVVIGNKDASGVVVRTKKRRVVQQGTSDSTSPAAKLSRKPAAQGSTPEQVKQWLGKPLAKLSAAVRERVHVVASVAEARAALPDETIPDDAAGAYTPDGVWLIADNLPSAQAANEALAHEVVGHLGVEGLLNEADFDDLVAQVGRLAAHDPTVRAALETVRRNYEGLDAVAEAKEVLAHLAERKPNFGLVRELLAKLRMWLARHGFGDLDKATLERLLVTAARQTSQRADPAGLATPAAGKAQFSRRGTDDTVPAFKAAQGWLKQEFKSGKAVGEGRGLGWLTMEQIAERYGDQVPALRAINTAIGTMEAQAKKWVGKAEHIDRLWQQLSKAQDKLMSEIMIAATLAGYDPDGGKTKTKGVTTPEEAALDRQWQHLQALDKGAKVPATSVYRAVRNHFEQDLAEVKAHLKDLKGKERTPQVEALIGALEGLSKGSQKPYFPLMRLGGYYTVGRSPELQALHNKRGANDDGLSKDEEKRYEALRKDAKHYVVASHARLANAERHRDKLLAQGMTAFANTAQERGAKHRSSIVEDMKTFDNAIKDINLDAGVKKQLEQVYESLLISSLPEGHVLKKSLRRDGVIGADTDMRRVVATSANSRAYALSRLQHARDVQESLGELRAASADGNMTERNLANEMVRRTNLAYEHYQDSPIITAMTTASYMGMLGASPAFWLINLTQVPLITAPWLAARTNKGFTATMRDLGVAAKQASQMIKWTTDGQWRAEFKLDNPPKGVTADEIKMFRALEDAGQLDFTLAFDLGQVAAGKSGKFWNVLRSVNAPTNATELINRGGTALAAYRAKRGQGADHAAAVEFAKQATNTTQINYNPANAARYMQTVLGSRGLAKIIFQFYTYQQGMAYLALSTLKDAVAGDKTAQKTMGYMTGTLVAMSGVFGLPFVSTLLSAASMALTKLGDDDEPVDLEVWLKNLMHDTIPGLDVLASKGAPAALLGIDLSSRTGQGNLMNPLAYARFGAKDRGEDTIQELMFRVFGGASAGTASGIVDGVKAIAEGDIVKGFEKIGPLKAVKDLAKFAQLQEGGVRTGSGEQALGAEAFHAGNLLAQAMGFSPTKKSLYYEGNAAVQNVKQAVDGVRTKLLSRYAQAFIAGKGFTEVHKEIREFNQRHPERQISWTSMTQSVKQRRTNRQERLPSGVAGGKDNQPFQQYGRFAQ